MKRPACANDLYTKAVSLQGKDEAVRWALEETELISPLFVLLKSMKSYSQRAGALLSLCLLLRERIVKGAVARWDMGKMSSTLCSWSCLQSTTVQWLSLETAGVWIRKSAGSLGINFFSCTQPGRGWRDISFCTSQCPVLDRKDASYLHHNLM